jgi:hypothetical protein
MLFSPHLESDWLFAAFLAVGSSYLSLLLLCIRLSVFPSLSKLQRHTYYLPWLVLYPSALYFAFFGSTTSDAGDIHVQLWIMPGYMGLVTGPLLILALFEVLVRRHQYERRRAAEALPQPLPVATAKIR